MNKVTLVGRLTRDVDSRTTESGKAMARFSVAVNRRFKNAEGNYDADFINCICYDKTAECIGKNFSKGSAIGIVGRIQTGSYTNKDGAKVYTTDVVVEDAEFVESKGGDTSTKTETVNNDFSFTPDDNEGLPFN